MLLIKSDIIIIITIAFSCPKYLHYEQKFIIFNKFVSIIRNISLLVTKFYLLSFIKSISNFKFMIHIASCNKKLYNYKQILGKPVYNPFLKFAFNIFVKRKKKVTNHIKNYHISSFHHEESLLNSFS